MKISDLIVALKDVEIDEHDHQAELIFWDEVGKRKLKITSVEVLSYYGCECRGDIVANLEFVEEDLQ